MFNSNIFYLGVKYVMLSDNSTDPVHNCNSNEKFSAFFSSASIILSIIISATGITVLFGWLFDITLLKSIQPSFVSMKTNAALCFILTGISIISWQKNRPVRHSMGFALAFLVTLIGFLTLVEYLFHINIGIDQLFFKDTRSAILTAFPNRMAPSTAFNFLVIGIALMSIDKICKNGMRLAQLFILLEGVVTVAALVGYLLGAEALYSAIHSFTAMGLHTTILFILIFFAVFFARPEHGIMALIISGQTAGLVFRPMLIIAIVCPFLVYFVSFAGQNAGLYSGKYATAISIILNIVSFSAISYLLCLSLAKTDAKRKNAEDEILRAYSELDERVKERTAELSRINNELIAEMSDRRRAEERLQQNQVMLARTESIAHIGSWEWDVAANKATWSDELFRIFQMEPSGGAPSFGEHHKLFHPDDLVKLNMAVEAAFKDGTPYKLELRAIRTDGETRFCLVRGYSHVGQSGQVERLFGLVQDINERKRLDHLIEKRLQLSSYALDHSMDDVLQKTLDLTEEMTGSSIGFYHYIDEDDQKVILQQWSTKTVKDFCKAEGYGLHYSIGQGGVWADSIRERRPIIHNDYESLPNKKGLPEGHAKVIRELVVPIFRNDRIVAILGVGNKHQDYTEHDIELVTFFADFAWDVAVHKQIEESLRQKEKIFGNLFNNFQLAMFRSKIDGSEVLDVNDKWLELVGKTREEVIGKPSVIHWVDPERRSEMVRILKSEGRVVDFEYQMVNEKIGIRDCLTSLTYYPESGILEGTISDITERKRMEKTLKESEERFRSAFEYAPIGVSIHELGGGFLRVNEAFCQIVGYSNEELYTRTYQDVTHRDDLSFNIELVERLYSGQEKIIRFNKRYVHKLGHEVPVSINVSMLRDESGKHLSLLSIVEDLTEKKKLEEQFRQSQKMEAIGILAGGVAHDFNNILMAIMSFGAMAKKRIKEDDHMKLFIDEILAGADRAAELTKGLLAFSRKQVISPRVLELNAIVKGISKMLKRIIGEDIVLKTALSKETIIVKVDSSQIDQVLLNLATNARDAMPDGGHLIIETSIVNVDNPEMNFLKDPGQYAVLTVSDTGIGMDPITSEKIFDPFFTTKGIGKGTGLGLAMVYGIVKQHEGSITVYSESNKGTTFKIYLPTVGLNSQGTVSIAVQEPLTGKGETLLLAEDDASVRKVTKITLEEAGYKVIEAKNGEEAVNKFIENKDSVRLLILDVIMPVQTGKDAYNAIKKIRPEQAVLFMSGYADDIVARKGILEEGLEFILKPVQPDVLLRKIRDLLDKA